MNITLEPITQKDFMRIYKLTSNPDVMKYIGNGQVWNHKKVSKFIQYCLEEENLDDSQREQYYYKIMDYNSSQKKSQSKSKNKLKTKSNSRRLTKSKMKEKLKEKLNKRGKFVGIIGFHKFIKGNEPYLTQSQKKRKNEFYLTIYFNPELQGKGYFPISMKLLIEKMKKHHSQKHSLYMMVREDNYRMNLHANKHYKFVSKIQMRPNLVLNEYRLNYQ